VPRACSEARASENSHIAQIRTTGFRIGFVSREGKHIRGSIVSEEIPVEGLDAGVIHQHNGQIGIRYAGKVKHDPGGTFQQIPGEGLARLVFDKNHSVFSCR